MNGSERRGLGYMRKYLCELYTLLNWRLGVKEPTVLTTSCHGTRYMMRALYVMQKNERLS